MMTLELEDRNPSSLALWSRSVNFVAEASKGIFKAARQSFSRSRATSDGREQILYRIPQHLHGVLLSNALPSDEETEEISALLAAFRVEWLTPTPSQTQLLAADAQHALELMSGIQQLSAALSSVRKLPIEIIRLILLDAHDYEELSPTVRCPWTLTHICHLWREVALSTATLWDTISVDVSLKSRKSKAYCTFLKGILNRSSNLKLRVGIYQIPNSTDSKTLLETLIEHCERWETLDLSLEPGAIMAFKNIRGRLPALQTLNIKILDPETIEVILAEMFLPSPALHTVTLDPHKHSLYFPILLSLPLNQLRYFSQLKFPSYAHAIINVSLLSNVQNLKLGWQGEFHPHNGHITLAETHTLFLLNGGHGRNPNGILETLTTPALKKFTLLGPVENTIPRVTLFVERSGCSLRSLRLLPMPSMAPGELITLLRLMPKLKLLEVTFPTQPELAELVLKKTSEGADNVVPGLRSATFAVPLSENVCGPLADTIRDVVFTRFEDRTTRIPGTNHMNSFSMTFELDVEARTVCKYLQGHVRVGRAGDHEPGYEEPDPVRVARLTGLKKALGDAIIWLKGHPTTRIRNAFKQATFNSNAPAIDRVFGEIEDCDPVSGANLRASQLHYTLYVIATQATASDIPGEKDYHFRSRASAVLDRWDPLLTNDVPFYRWLCDDKKVTYVPSYVHNRTRTLPRDKCRSLLYGWVDRSVIRFE